MHSCASRPRSLDETARAVDLEQIAAPTSSCLSFTDSDLAVLAKAWERRRRTRRPQPAARQPRAAAPSLFGRSLCREGLRSARFVLVRLLGGLDYWRYGVEELARRRAGEGDSRSPSCPATPARTRGSTPPRRCRRERPAPALALFRGGRPGQCRACPALLALNSLGQRLQAPPPRAKTRRLGRFRTRQHWPARGRRAARALICSTAPPGWPATPSPTRRWPTALARGRFRGRGALSDKPQGPASSQACAAAGRGTRPT